MSSGDASGRPAFSHVTAEGTPKRVLDTPEAAKEWAAHLEGETGAMFSWYECGERPAHWHVSRVRVPPSVRIPGRIPGAGR